MDFLTAVRHRQWPCRQTPGITPGRSLPVRRAPGRPFIRYGWLLLLLLSGASGHADNHETGIGDYLQGRYDAAFSRLTTHAHQGHPRAQYTLGLAWLHGRGTPRDRARAYAWFAAGEASGHWPSRLTRRELHAKLRVGELPRAERLARQYVSEFSGKPYTRSRCFMALAGKAVTACDDETH